MGRTQFFKPVVVDQYNDLYREGGTKIPIKSSGSAGGNTIVEDSNDPGTYIIGS